MVKLNISSDGFKFSAIQNEESIKFEEWGNTDDCIFYFPLATLVDNGYAIILNESCIVPFENIYLLDDEERLLLGIPPMYDKTIRLRSKGMLNTSSFSYEVEYLTNVPDGHLLSFERNGNIISNHNEEYLLSESQYELLMKLDMYNSTNDDIKTTDYNLRTFAEIKELAKKCHCYMDSYLENENVVVPQKIKIEVGQDSEGYTIDPSLEIEENEQFKHTFDRMRKVQAMYPLQKENGERVRVVFNSEQKANLTHLKENGGRHKSREQIRMITEHPTEYFDPELFDLSELYSDRVIEIGVYKPRFYPFVSPYKSSWIAGAKVETPENGTTKINICSEDELVELRQCINDAEDNNKNLVSYQDTQIDIEDAKFLANMAEKQLRNPQTPYKPENASRKVLIIEENAEEVGYKVEQREIERNNKYTLFTNPFLRASFTLKGHQEEGIAWLQYLYGHKASGCLIADDMGLGKTLQILYFIDWHSRKNPEHKPYLIVAPISLLENWEKEYKRFFKEPCLRVHKITSNDVPRKFDKDIIKEMQMMDIILTNYETLRNAQLNFCAVEFDVVALDEAQKIKTPGTLVTNAAKALKSNFRIAMTGTPVENSLLDLWCIMDFCVPGLLGNAKAFAAKYQNPLKNEDTDIVQLGNEVHEELGIYFMRRLKKDVAKDLPEKHELKKLVEMPSIQEATYKDVINSYIDGLQPNMLVTIMDIREVSEHPYLYDSTLPQHESNELIETSARLQATIKFLDDIRDKGEKVIIFSERKESQKMLQKICRERYGIIAKIINGDTPSIVVKQYGGMQSRQSSIDEFQSVNGFNIIIMSPIAAGMGLNVTAANHVIHYSRHWNPAKENQATDRAYRIGQEKDVYVYYPMAVSKSFTSFDETLDDLLNRKTSLATSTIFPTERVEVKTEDFSHILLEMDASDMGNLRDRGNDGRCMM